MKILNVGFVCAFSLTLVAGMGSKSKHSTAVEEPKVLPESTRASSPAAVTAPVRLIENTAEENKKVDDALKTSAPVTDNTSSVVKATKKVKAKIPAKKKKSAPAPKAKSKKTTKKKR